MLVADGAIRAHGLRDAHHDAHQQHQSKSQTGCEGHLVTRRKLAKLVAEAGRGGDERIIVQMALNVACKAVGRFVTSRPIFFPGTSSRSNRDRHERGGST
jgi:hypothetical protein